MMDERLKSKTLSGLFWIFFERSGAQVVSFIVSVVLARLLSPEDYGVISLILVFISICDVFVEGGFGNALIQKKDADDLDFSSVFYFSFIFSVVIYIIVFFAAPFIAEFYAMPIIMPVVRVMGLRIIVASINSVQKSVVSRNMQFKRFFFSTVIGTLISAVVGIVMAYAGFGVWALVGQYFTNTVLNTFILAVTINWRPKAMFSIKRLKTLISYGWKVLAASLVDNLYENFRSLYIGKLYTAQDLAYYTKGKQFPNLVVTNINSSITSVLFPVISSKQDDRQTVKAITRRAIKTSSYIIMPFMFGLAAIAEPLVTLLLTEKWLPCVPFLQILCFNSALMPIQSANSQAIYAVGRSDIALKTNIVKKSFGFLMVLFTARISVMAMAFGGIFTGIFCSVVNAYPNSKLLGYKYFEQIKDILPYVVISAVMCMFVLLIKFLNLSVALTLVMQIVVGMVIYILLSVLFKIDSFWYVLDTLKSFFDKMIKGADKNVQK